MVTNIKNAFHRSLVDTKQPRKESSEPEKDQQILQTVKEKKKKKKTSVGVKQNVVCTYEEQYRKQV